MKSILPLEIMLFGNIFIQLLYCQASKIKLSLRGKASVKHALSACRMRTLHAGCRPWQSPHNLLRPFDFAQCDNPNIHI